MPYVKKGFGPALQRNYDKIIFAVAIVFLVVSVVFLSGARGRIAVERNAFIDKVDSLRPDHADLAPADMAPVDEASRLFASPFSMGTNKVFLVAQERVRCINPKCRHPIPFDADTCGFCGTEQPGEGATTGGDSDGDGLPDEFEKLYAFLNPVDAADADLDYDKDGFSNIEEYEAGTDPSNPASHPSKVEFLRVASLEEDTIAFRLMGSMRLGPERIKYQIKGISQDFNVLPGEEFEDPRIPGGKFKIVAVETITEMRKKQGYTEPRPVEVPVAVISNGKVKYRLAEGAGRGASGEFRATFVCTKDVEAKEYLGLPGQPFTFDNEEFTVFKVDRNHGSVLIHRVSDNKEFTVPRQ